jgi:hypothetical protein
MCASEIEIVLLERPFIKRAASIAAAAFRDEPGATAFSTSPMEPLDALSSGARWSA